MTVRYTVHGLIEARPVSITWDAGALEGDAAAIEELCALALVLDGRQVGPEPDGPFTWEDHLKSPTSTLVLIEDVFDEITGCAGQVPQVTRQAA